MLVEGANGHNPEPGEYCVVLTPPNIALSTPIHVTEMTTENIPHTLSQASFMSNPRDLCLSCFTVVFCCFSFSLSPFTLVLRNLQVAADLIISCLAF